ncbi:unnamed protein product, partial [Prorocentrum cordatum]
RVCKPQGREDHVRLQPPGLLRGADAHRKVALDEAEQPAHEYDHQRERVRGSQASLPRGLHPPQHRTPALHWRARAGQPRQGGAQGEPGLRGRLGRRGSQDDVPGVHQNGLRAGAEHDEQDVPRGLRASLTVLATHRNTRGC